MTGKLGLALLALVCATAGAVADLHDPLNRADYLIITTEDILQQTEWLAELAEWRQAHGRTVMLVGAEEIWTEFGNGMPSDTVLRDFLHYAQANWQPPRLADVFIVGAHDVVPSHVVESPYDTTHRDSYLSDLFLASPPDNPNLAPTLAIGRLPWSPAQGVPLPNYWEKVVAYETTPAAPWQSRVHMIADLSQGAIHWPTISEAMIESLPTGFEATRDYADEGARHDSVMAHWNSGHLLTIYNGWVHIGEDQLVDHWSDTLRLDSASMSTLTNGAGLPIVMGTGWEIRPEGVAALPRELLYNPAGGAIAMIAASGFSYLGTNNYFRRIFLEAATDPETETVGELWQAIVAPGGPSMRDHLSIFGDPGLRIPHGEAPAAERPTAVPNETRLDGNYPNPFNASTQIQFTLAQSGRVTLKVFDVLGRDVATLVDAPRAAGQHRVLWQAQNQATGVYFVELIAGGQRQVAKVMLLK